MARQRLAPTLCVALLLLMACGSDNKGASGSEDSTEASDDASTSDASEASTLEGSGDATADSESSDTETDGTTGGGNDECVLDSRWTTQELGLPGPRALVADADGDIHLLASPNTADIEHRTFGAGGFSDPQVIMAGLDGEPLAAADANGGLHVVVVDGPTTAYLKRDAGQPWSVEMDEGAHGGSDMVVDASGALHLIGSPAVYRRRDIDGTWLDDVSIGSGEGHPGIAMMNGAPLACFSDATGYKQCALGDPDGSFPQVDAINEFANFMQMDGPGERAYLYLNRLHNGTTWEAGLTVIEGTTVVDQQVVETGTGIGIAHMRGTTGPNERPHAGYVLITNATSGDLGLRHATLTDGAWEHSWAACGLDTALPAIAANDQYVVVVYHQAVRNVGTRMFAAYREL